MITRADLDTWSNIHKAIGEKASRLSYESDENDKARRVEANKKRLSEKYDTNNITETMQKEIEALK